MSSEFDSFHVALPTYLLPNLPRGEKVGTLFDGSDIRLVKMKLFTSTAHEVTIAGGKTETQMQLGKETVEALIITNVNRPREVRLAEVNGYPATEKLAARIHSVVTDNFYSKLSKFPHDLTEKDIAALTRTDVEKSALYNNHDRLIAIHLRSSLPTDAPVIKTERGPGKLMLATFSEPWGLIWHHEIVVGAKGLILEYDRKPADHTTQGFKVVDIQPLPREASRHYPLTAPKPVALALAA